MQSGYITLEVGAADNLDFRRQFAAVNRQIDVRGIVVRGDDDRRRRFDAGFAKHVDVSGTAVDIAVVADPRPLFFNDAIVEVALAQRSGGRTTHPSPAQDKKRVLVFSMPAQLAVEDIELLLGARQQENRRRIDDGLGAGHDELAPFPQPHHVDPHRFAQLVLLEGLAHERRAHGGRLGDQEGLDPPDDVGRGGCPDDPARQGLAEHSGKLDHVRAPGQLEDIDGIVEIGIGHNGHLGRNFTDGEGDVGIDHVVDFGDHQSGFFNFKPLIRLRITKIADNHLEA